jgi:hypothetical protein
MKVDENIHQKSKNNQNDEIDLVKIFSAVYQAILSFLKLIVRFFFNLVDAIYEDRKIIAVFTFLGILLGFGFFYSTKPYYESSMTLNSNYFKGELLGNSIENLNEVCKEKNHAVLSSLLNIPRSTAQQVKSIKLYPVLSQNYRSLYDLYTSDERYQGKLDSLIMYNNESNYRLNVEVYDTTALKGLDTVLANYIKNNEYVKKRIAIDTTNLRIRRRKLIRESTSLDTLKRSIAASIKSSGDAGRSGTNNVILGEKNVNPIEIYREDLEIFNQRQDVERQLALNAEIEVVQKFIPYANPKSGSLITNALKGAIGGFIIALLYVLYKILRQGLMRLRYTVMEEEVA